MSFTDLLAAIVIFVNGAKGISALQMSRDLDCQYKTAFVLAHKLREATAAEQANAQLGGVVEIDGAYFGGYVKPENRKEDRKDRRLLENRTGKRQCVVIMHERKGRSLPFVVANDGDAVPYVRDNVGTLATIHADEGSGWDALHAGWDAKRVNHSIAFKDNGVCTNQAESYFSRLRRMEIGTHHHIAGEPSRLSRRLQLMRSRSCYGKTKYTLDYPAEVRERAVRLVMDHQGEHNSQWEAISSIAARLSATLAAGLA
jgi:hypothetical protein